MNHSPTSLNGTKNKVHLNADIALNMLVGVR